MAHRQNIIQCNELLESWLYASSLQLLEDQVLVATEAQETWDLIKILADLYKRNGDTTCVLAVAHFRLDDEKSGLGALHSITALSRYKV